MNILYKRIVTMCMICISSLLAWVYCIIEFKDKPAVIVGMSVLFVVSMYALLNAYIDIKNKKEEKLESMINSAVNDTLSKLNNDEKTIELERILKASYVQSRKTNTILTNSNQINADNLQALMELLTSQNDTNRESLNSSLNKTAKIIAKYGKNDSEKIITSLEEYFKTVTNLSTQVADIQQALLDLSSIQALSYSKQPNLYNNQSEASAEDPDVNSFLNEFASPENDDDNISDISNTIEDDQTDMQSDESDTLSSITDSEDYDPNKQLSPDEIAALFANANEATPADEAPLKDDSLDATTVEDATVETTVASPIEEPVDPNKQLSPDEIAALFAAASGEDSSTNEDTIEENIIVEDTIESTATAPIEEPADPNKQLSPDEIAALFAAASGDSNNTSKDVVEEAPVIEEVPVPEAPLEEPVDPNKQLSPDEIAALFAAASGDSNNASEDVVEGAPVIEAPLEEPVDPNKQLSPDEIAALFAASKEEHKANSMDDFSIHEHPESMDQNLIDALLNLDASDEEILANEEDALSADVIPFPTKELEQLEEELLGDTNTEEKVKETTNTESAPISEEFDPNKKMSPDEIAALFASMSSVGEEKTIEEIDSSISATSEEDQLIGTEPKQEKEQPAATPIPALDPNDDPNRQLSPDEIAALFASMQ